LRIVHEERVDADRDVFFSWWTDYSESDHAHSKRVTVERRVIVREGNTVLLEDRFLKPLRFTERIKVDMKPPERLYVHGENRMWFSVGTFTFKLEDGSVLMILDIEIRPRGLWKLLLLLPFIRWKVSDTFVQDIRDHISDFHNQSSSERRP
jgi:hypothetical protein